jgi:hypothetical protein
MATVTLHPYTTGPGRVGASVPAAPKTAPVELAPFWSSLFEARAARGDARPEKPSAVVGDLWIQIR